MTGLFDFAWFPAFDESIDELASLAEPENWEYQFARSDKKNPVLRSYVRYTFDRILTLDLIRLSGDQLNACWNTGLISISQEDIYCQCKKNPKVDQQEWKFSRFCKKSDNNLNSFSVLPEIATYYTDPASIVFDARIDIRANYEHIIDDNIDRFPDDLRNQSRQHLVNVVRGAVEGARERARRNYKIAVPQYYQDRIQLLLPLCLQDVSRADMALVLDHQVGFYRAATCLTLDMAYNNARLITRPDRDWLQP